MYNRDKGLRWKGKVGVFLGILYLDEAGNTGLWDRDQTILIYGGPYVNPSLWKKLSHDLVVIQAKYKALIMSRFKSGLKGNLSFTQLESGVSFLSDFNFHAKNIVNRKALWGKLDDYERFDVLDDVIESLITHNVPFYVGMLDKVKIRPKKKKKRNDMREYKQLFREFLGFVEGEIDEHSSIVTIIDDGDSIEKEMLMKSIADEELTKFFGELVSGKYDEYPLLQVADIGIWVIQAYNRLDERRTDDYAESVRRLYTKLQKVLKIHNC